jgi:NAD(P)H-nitrite reductase large subunit
MNVGANIILDAVHAKNLASADDVATATGAGSGCGSCRPEIQRMLEQSMRETPSPAAPAVRLS